MSLNVRTWYLLLGPELLRGEGVVAAGRLDERVGLDLVRDLGLIVRRVVMRGHSMVGRGEVMVAALKRTSRTGVSQAMQSN